MLDAMLDAEADQINRTYKYERSEDRIDTHARHYARKLLATAGQVNFEIPKPRKLPLETACRLHPSVQNVQGH